MKRALLSTSEALTAALGVRLGQVLSPRDFVGLVGQLGAGKTLFSRAVAEGAGAPPEDVSSPTYSIIQTYAAARGPLHHADLYRLRSEDELFATGYFEHLEEDEAAMLVEWIDHIPSAVPESWLRVELVVLPDGQRRLLLEAVGERAEALMTRWLSSPETTARLD